MSGATVSEGNWQDALHQSEARMQRVQALAHVGNWELTLEGMHMWASREAFSIYGLDEDAAHMDLRKAQDIVLPEDREKLDNALAELIAGKAAYDMEFRVRRVGDSSLRIIHSIAECERDGKGRPVKVVGVIQDITDIRQAEEEYRAIIQATMDGFLVCDTDGNLLRVNDAMCRLFGYSRNQLLTMNVRQLEAVRTSEEVDQHMLRIIANGTDRFEAQYHGNHESILTIEVSCTYLPANGKVCAFMRDITERKNKEEEIAHLSYHDLLTGLYNRAFFEEECRRLDTDREMPIAVIMGDLNGLKFTNDVFGHEYGDKLLVAIAGIFRSSLRKSDIVARCGGDEFCVLLPHTREQETMRICEHIHASCKDYREVHADGILQLSISLGYAAKSHTGQALGDILKNAEAMMYRHKMVEHKSMNGSMISSIRNALFEKSHETREHAERLVGLTRTIGSRLSMSQEELHELELLSLLHDIGKVLIDDRILMKPDKLTETEWAEIRKHPETGQRIAMASPELAPIADDILCHHEWWNGQGYPQGLKEREIPLLARILSIADSFDSMSSDRVFRKGMSRNAAVEEVKFCSGSQFDPEIVKVFLEVVAAT